MSTPLPPTILLATAMGLTFNSAFTTGSMALSNVALPTILLPSDAPLMPPLNFVHKRKSEHFRSIKLPDEPNPTKSGADVEPQQVLAGDRVNSKLTPSSTNYLLRQWFHVFAKGMHTYPPMAVGAALAYLYCAIMVPGDYFPVTDQLRRGCFVLAFLFSASVPPFTLTMMKEANSRLNERVEEVCRLEKGGEKGEKVEEGRGKKEESERLIRAWGRMNVVRSYLPVVAAVCATVGLILPG